VDGVAPLRITLPPIDDPDKKANIAAKEVLLTNLASKVIPNMGDVHSVCAYMEFGADGTLIDDRRWRITELVEYLFKKLPRSAKVQMARASRVRSIQIQAARIVQSTAATLTSVVVLNPIPLADLPVLVALQSAAVGLIAYIGGRDLNGNTYTELLKALGVNVAVGFGLRMLADALASFVPGFGSVIKAAVAVSATWVICEAAIAYFIEEKRGDDLKAEYEEAKKHVPQLPAPDADLEANS
jgi:uncharacterized protein (DUF697 family)